MTNVEAAKIGYKDCEFKPSEILCRANLEGVTNVEKATLTFDAKSKRLVSIYVYISVLGPWGLVAVPDGGWNEDSDWATLSSELEARALRELKIPDCKSNLRDDYIRPATRESTCFILPNQMRRTVAGYNNIRSGGWKNRNVPHAAVIIEAMMGTEVQNRARHFKAKRDDAEKRLREEERRQRFMSGQ